MSSVVGPWSVKGIDPRAREIAKDQARRSGQTLGEWLNTRIIDPDAAEPADPALAAAVAWGEPNLPSWSERTAAADARPDARPDVRQDARSDPRAGPRAATPEPRGWVERPTPPRDPRAEDMRRVADALGELGARLEAAERRSTLAISGIDQQVTGVLTRLDHVDDEHTDATARLEEQVVELRGIQTKLGERLRAMHDQEGPRVEAMKALEIALGKVALQIHEGEARHRVAATQAQGVSDGLALRIDEVAQTADAAADAELVEARLADLAARLEQTEARTTLAVRALETSFGGLDRRMADMRRAPESAEAALDDRFGRLAAELSRKVEDSRGEVAAKLRELAGGKLAHMEARLGDIASQVTTSERRSAQAIDAMGREVVRIAQGLGGRLAASEARQAETDRRVGGEMDRMVRDVDARLKGAASAQTEALERLGGEIAHIAERLADRIAASERRATQDAAQLGDKLTQAVETLRARADANVGERSPGPAAEDVPATDPVKASPPPSRLRTLSSPAMDPAAGEGPVANASLDMAEPPDAVILPPSAVARASRAEPAAAVDVGPFEPPSAWNPGPFASHSAFDPAFGALSTFESAAVPATPDPFVAGWRRAASTLEALPPQLAPAVAPPATATSAEHDLFIDAPAAVAPAVTPPPPPKSTSTSTRELIEAARAAAREAAETRQSKTAGDAKRAVAAPGFDAEDTGGVSIGAPWRRRREAGASLRTFAISSVVAGSIAATGAGAWLLSAGDGRRSTTADAPTAARPPEPNADTLAMALAPPAPEPSAASASAPAKIPAHATLKTDPESATRPAGSLPAPQLFAAASTAIGRGDRSGLADLHRAANLGYAPAQFYLARLYEEGRAGAPKDLVEARRWTERAALQGDTHAMFNLGLFFANGDGGEKNAPSAVTWFARAAQAGVRDAQYNLAVMHQNGEGTRRDPQEAYKWYLVAAASGDTGARDGAEHLKSTLSSEQRAAAEKDAAALGVRLAASAKAPDARTPDARSADGKTVE